MELPVGLCTAAQAFLALSFTLGLPKAGLAQKLTLSSSAKPRAAPDMLAALLCPRALLTASLADWPAFSAKRYAAEHERYVGHSLAVASIIQSSTAAALTARLTTASLF